MANFEDLMFLFTCDNRNRGIIRMNFDEAACLWKAVRSTNGNIVEIGRRHGGSTVLLLAASDSTRNIISIDIEPAHHPLAEAYFRKPDCACRLTLVVADSREYKTGPFGLIFIDGDHSYEGVAADVEAHWAQLSSYNGYPGIAVFHDAVPNDGLAYANQLNHCTGVKEVCDRLINAGVGRVVAKAGSVLVLEKITELPPKFFKVR